MPAYVCCARALLCAHVYSQRFAALDTHQCAGVIASLVSLATGRKGLESWPLSWRTCLVGMFCHRDSAQKGPLIYPKKAKLKPNIWLLKIRPLD